MSDNTKQQQRDETADTVLYITASTKQDFKHLFQTSLKKMVYEPSLSFQSAKLYCLQQEYTSKYTCANAQHDTLKQVYHA